MEFLKKSIKASPYLGVFCVLTDKYLIHPHGLYKKEFSGFEKFEVELIPATIASSSLIGVFSKGLNEKLLATYLIEDKEKKELEKKGLKVKTIDSTAIGNLIAVNENGGIASPLLTEKQVKETEKFFEVPFKVSSIGGSDLTGSCICVTNKGFVVHPNISEKEFTLLEKIFKVKGMPATANYGDRFVANSIIANSKGIAAGENTSGPEMARIDEGIGRE
ncbi:MAG: translation initiation factor IF-6 [Candidatus Diapherotrites archaeon]|nr:translation initiation factor IF-6 [Candidatus Diapherotrites archaeon]